MPQHVIQRGNNRSPCFAATSDFLFYRDCLRQACERHACRVHAYAFLTNHVHLLLTPTTEDGIPRVMQTVGRRYVRRFNATYRRTGTLWEGRYRAALVETREYLLACHRYIELNPVRAGLVADPRRYRWSSHAANAFGSRDVLITPHEEYLALGTGPRARQAAYQALFVDPLPDDTLGAIRDATNKGCALGSDHFRAEIATLLGRRTQPSWADVQRPPDATG